MSLNYNFSEHQVIEILDSLFIRHSSRPNSKGWIFVQCPYHHSTKMTTARINVYHGGFNCFSCGKVSGIIGILQEFKNLSYKQTLEYLQLNDPGYYQDLPEIKRDVEVRPEIPYDPKMGILEPVDSLKWKYTRDRHITEEWLTWSGSQLCRGGKYNDYLIIPIIDKEKNLIEYEARKVKEYEYLVSYYGEGGERELRDRWLREEKEKKYEIEYDGNYWYCESVDGSVYDFRVVYLARPKTLYRNNNIDLTIYNRNSLAKDAPLYVEEGLGADSINRKVFQNLTCTFGSNISDKQLQILKEFPEIIVIPDNDEASLKMIVFLSENHNNVKVIDKIKDDKDYGYEEELRKAPVMDAHVWIFKYKFSNRKQLDYYHN